MSIRESINNGVAVMYVGGSEITYGEAKRICLQFEKKDEREDFYRFINDKKCGPWMIDVLRIDYAKITSHFVRRRDGNPMDVAVLVIDPRNDDRMIPFESSHPSQTLEVRELLTEALKTWRSTTM